jgi:hypothetical protein
MYGTGEGAIVTIEAVIWDFGGVLTTSPFEAYSSRSAATS